MKENLSAYIYFAGWRIVRWLPEKTAYTIAYAVADFMTRKNGKSVKRLRTNLQRTQPEITTLDLELLTFQAMRSYMRYWCDTFRMPDWSPAKINFEVELVNGEYLTDPLDNGRGVVVALPHSGNWDHAAAYFLGRGYRAVTVAERLKPEKVFQAFLKYRQELGLEVLASDMRSIPTLIKRAEEGCIIALVADRDLSANGTPVNFFGKSAKMPAGPVVISQKANVDLVGSFIVYTDNSIKIYFEKLEKSVQAEADFFAKHIAAHPVDWHMLQRIWLDD
jgi:lauroyl/myristoyl acyltransferase